MSSAFWIIITGSFVAISCAILGSYLLLRRMTMLGDAISHSVLPGIVIGFLLAGSRESIFLIFGAASFGMLSVLLIEGVQKKMKLQSDAAIGISFTFLFAVGVILISQFAGKVDLDQDCVLFGEIAYVSLDTWVLDSGAELGPIKTWTSGGMLLMTLLFVFLFWKELRITTFDPAFSEALGIRTSRWHYLLMMMVSMATVTAFDSVGAILVVAFLVVPPATGYLLSRDLFRMMLIAAATGFLSALGGYYFSAILDASISGSMAVVAGTIFIAAWGISSLRKT